MRDKKWPMILMVAFVPTLGVLSGCGGGGGTNGRTVTGTLFRADQNGAALTNATVSLLASGKAVHAQLTRDISIHTDANGRYQFSNVPPASYTLQVTTQDGSYQEADVPISVDQDTPVAPIGLIPSSVQLDHINIILPAADGQNNSYLLQHTYQFRAEVYDKSGNKLANWQPNWSVEGGIGTIDSTGKFTASALGSGKIDAFFYVKDQQVLFGSPTLSVSKDSSLPSLTLDVLAPNVGGHSNYGLDAFDASSGTEMLAQSVPSITTTAGSGDLLARDSAGTQYVYEYNASSPMVYQVSGGVKQTLRPLPPFPASSKYPSAAYAMTVLPNGHLVVAAYTVSFSYNGFTTLQPDGTWSTYRLANQYSSVRAMTVGPDGKLYVSGRQNSIERIDRYNISGDDLTLDTTLISASGNSRFGAIGFSRNGDMILADYWNNQLLAYTSSGAPTQKVFALPKLAIGLFAIDSNFQHSRFIVGSSVLKQNDEVLFVIGQKGIYRVDYTSGNFAAIDTDTSSNPTPFLSTRSGGIFQDLVLY